MLIVGVMTATLVFSSMNLYRVWQLNHERLTDSLKKRTEFAAIAFDQWVNSQKEPLAMLADVVGDGPPDERSIESALASRSLWQNIVLVDRAGTVLLSRSKNGQVPKSMLDGVLRNVQEQKTPILSADRTGGDERPIFTVAAPTRSGGAVVAQIDGMTVKELFDDVELADDSVVAVLGKQGAILYRRSSTNVTVASDILGTALINALGDDRTTIAETESPFDGVRRVYGLVRTEESGNVIIIGVASDRFYDPLWQQMYSQILINIVILFAAIGVALLVAYSILRSLHALKTATYMFATGDRGARAPQESTGELGELGKTFNWMAEQINQREEQLRELDRLKSEFVSSVSHELKTPLTTIKTLVHVLGSNKLDARDRAQHLQVIATECDRQISLVSNVLDLSQIEAGKNRYQFAETDVARVLEELADQQSTAAGLKRITLELDVEPGLPSVNSNLDALQRVFRELTDNAIKYTSDGGRVRISASAGESEIEIRITDNGCGIHHEDIGFVFDRFFRARPGDKSPDPTNSSGGAGLGLYVSRRIVEQLGGSIQAAAADDGGTVMTVRLPRAQGENNGKADPIDR